MNNQIKDLAEAINLTGGNKIINKELQDIIDKYSDGNISYDDAVIMVRNIILKDIAPFTGE